MDLEFKRPERWSLSATMMLQISNTRDPSIEISISPSSLNEIAVGRRWINPECLQISPDFNSFTEISSDWEKPRNQEDLSHTVSSGGGDDNVETIEREERERRAICCSVLPLLRCNWREKIVSFFLWAEGYLCQLPTDKRNPLRRQVIVYLDRWGKLTALLRRW